LDVPVASRAELPREPGRKLKMIEPPTRGDRLAWPWVMAGVVIYLFLATVFLLGLVRLGDGFFASVIDLVGLGDPMNPAIAALVFGGVALTMIATLSVVRDIAAIRSEEDDVEWLLRHGREGAPLTLAPEKDRERLFHEGHRSMPRGDHVRVETLADDRVRRAHEARTNPGSASVQVEELRVIAERRTARFGAFARYASSLLLLFAVLGTFAGVKTALPGLIEAVSAAEGGTTGTAASIQRPLKAVSDAFGGNALALIGAIAVGLMAHGLSVGRRHLLERLELASAEYVYGEESSHSADPLKDAVLALRKTAEEIHQSSGAFLGIENGLVSLGSDFKVAFGSLDDRLLQVLHHQESGLYERTTQTLDELQNRVAELAEVVDANTRSYAGLVDRIGERAAESQRAIQELRSTNEQLTKALEGLIRLGDASAEASAKVKGSSDTLAENTTRVGQQIEALTRSMQEAKPVFSHVQQSLDQSAARLAAMEERAARSWQHVGEEMIRRMEDASNRIVKAAAASGGRGALSGTPAGPSPAQLVALPALGLVVGVLLAYVLAKADLFSLLPGF
jgi:methyl-accepting chemotaxis protein